MAFDTFDYRLREESRVYDGLRFFASAQNDIYKGFHKAEFYDYEHEKANPDSITKKRQKQVTVPRFELFLTGRLRFRLCLHVLGGSCAWGSVGKRKGFGLTNGPARRKLSSR